MEKFILKLGSGSMQDLEPAIEVLKRRTDEDVEYFSCDGFILGVVKTPRDNARAVENKLYYMVIIGDLSTPETDPQILDTLSNPGKIFTDFRGDAVVIVYDKENKITRIIVEPWFRRVVYHTKGTDSDLVGSEMKGLIALDRKLSQVLDMQAVYSYIAFNAVYGHRTLFEGINVLPSGSVNEFTNGLWQKTGRYNYIADYDYELDTETHKHRLAELFRNKVNELADKGYTALFLSGGLDSRLILAAYDRKYRDRIVAVHMGNQFSTDTKYARQTATTAGVKFHMYETNPEDIVKRAERQAWVTEGGLFLGTSILEAAIEGYTNMGYVDGNPGDLSLGGTWANKLSRHKVSKKNKYYSMGLVLGEPIGRDSIDERMIKRLFGDEKAEEIMVSLFTMIQEDISIFDFTKNHMLAIEYYAMHNRVRRAMGSMVLEYTDFERPFMDDVISEECFRVPIEIRSDRYYQLEVIRLLDADLASLPSTSMQYVEQATSTKSKVISLIKSTGKKIPALRALGRRVLNRRLASKPEDKYIRADTWLREDEVFREYIANHLNDFRERNIVNSEIIDKLMEEHMAKQFNHMKIFNKLVNLELVLKQFMDGRGFKS